MPELQTLIREAIHQEVLHTSDIPALELYVDQIVTLMERAYASSSKNPGDKPLTKSMINNYSKEGLIRPIKGKKYTREHVLQMLVIYSLKSTLSIVEIGKVMKALDANGGFGEDALSDCYEQAAALADEHSRALGGLLEQTAEKTGAGNDIAGLLITLMTAASLSRRMQRVSELLVERCFPEAESRKA